MLMFTVNGCLSIYKKYVYVILQIWFILLMLMLMQMLKDASLKESTLWKQIIKMCLLICFFSIFKKYLLSLLTYLLNICII